MLVVCYLLYFIINIKKTQEFVRAAKNLFANLVNILSRELTNLRYSRYSQTHATHATQPIHELHAINHLTNPDHYQPPQPSLSLTHTDTHTHTHI